MIANVYLPYFKLHFVGCVHTLEPLMCRFNAIRIMLGTIYFLVRRRPLGILYG